MFGKIVGEIIQYLLPMESELYLSDAIAHP